MKQENKSLEKSNEQMLVLISIVFTQKNLPIAQS